MFGNLYTTRLLTVSNSMRLGSQAGLNSFVMTLRNGWNRPGLSASSLRLVAMAVLTPTRRLPLSLPLGSLSNSNCIWSRSLERLKTEEMKQLGWDIKRNLVKINYRIHTDAIKENLIPPELSAKQVSMVYASEA